MKILVTGANGFVGKNLIAELRNREYCDICEYDKDTPPELLVKYCTEADFVFHLAGVANRLDYSVKYPVYPGVVRLYPQAGGYG